MAISRGFSIFFLAAGTILLVTSLQAVQASTMNDCKIDWLKSVSEDERLHQSTSPATIKASGDSNGGPEGVK